MKQIWQKLGTLAFWLSWPALYVYLNRSERTRVVVQAEGKLLLVKIWLGNGKWGLPGGGLHRGEPKNAGALRELAEETSLCLAVEDLRLLGTEQCHYHGFRYECHYFAAELTHIVPLKKQRLEIIDAGWFGSEELAKTTVQPEVRRALELLAEA